MPKNAVLCSVAVLLMTGCTNGSTAGRQSPKPSATATATLTVGATVSPAATPGLNCRLPVNSPAQPGVPPGGWITFPGGQFERDPASLRIRLQAHVPSYDRAIDGWLPVEDQYVAPSGDSYILTNEASLPDPGAFYLVDVKTGTRRMVLTGNGPPQAPGSWTVVDFASAGVYLWSAGISPVPGLWLLNPATGKVALVDGSHYWFMVANGVAWALDPQGWAPGLKQAVYRLDIASGRVERWYETDNRIYLISPDSNGHVLVVIGDALPPRLGLLVGPDRLQSLALPPDFPWIDGGYQRNPGVWMALRRGGLALYTASDGVQIMTRQTEIFDVAGGCW